jgi:hypothetical protein
MFKSSSRWIDYSCKGSTQNTLVTNANEVKKYDLAIYIYI